MYFELLKGTLSSTTPSVDVNNATTSTSSYILTNLPLNLSTTLDKGNYSGTQTSSTSSVSYTPRSGSNTTTQIQTESSTANSTSGIAITASTVSSQAAVTPKETPTNVISSTNEILTTMISRKKVTLFKLHQH